MVRRVFNAQEFWIDMMSNHYTKRDAVNLNLYTSLRDEIITVNFERNAGRLSQPLLWL